MTGAIFPESEFHHKPNWKRNVEGPEKRWGSVTGTGANASSVKWREVKWSEKEEERSGIKRFTNYVLYTVFKH